MLCYSSIHRPIVSKKNYVSYRSSKIVMKNSKCSNSENIEDAYAETMKKLSQPAIEPIIEHLKVIDGQIEETTNLLYDVVDKLSDIIVTLDKIEKNEQIKQYPYDNIYVDGIRETNDVY